MFDYDFHDIHPPMATSPIVLKVPPNPEGLKGSAAAGEKEQRSSLVEFYYPHRVMIATLSKAFLDLHLQPTMMHL